MNPRQPRTKADIVLNLMCFSGMTLIVCTIPEGIAMGLQVRYEMHMGWRDTFVVSTSMMAMMLVTGVILCKVSLHFLKKRPKARPDPDTD